MGSLGREVVPGRISWWGVAVELGRNQQAMLMDGGVLLHRICDRDFNLDAAIDRIVGAR